MLPALVVDASPGTLLVNRKTGRNLIYVPRAAVAVCGGTQPRTLAAALAGRYSSDGSEALEKPSAEHFANGLAARLLLAMPPPTKAMDRG